MRRVSCNQHHQPVHLGSDDAHDELLHPDGKACHSTTFSVTEVVSRGYAWAALTAEAVEKRSREEATREAT